MPIDEQPRRVVDIFLRYLKSEGCEVVFGIPGGLLHPFFDAVEQDPGLRLVVSRHEEGAAFMADGYARISHRLAVCAGTSGPGATNLLTGVAVAYADGVPLLVVTGQASSEALGKGAAQETGREDIDIVEMFRPVTKYSAMVPSPGLFAHHLRRALRRALSGRPGPVHLNVPVDFWEKRVVEEWFDPASFHPATRPFDRQAVQDAAVALLEAQFPAILVGSGVGIAGGEDHLRTLAELLPAVVATSPRGKGLFPEDHPLSLGVLGVAGHALARDVILRDEVDVLLTAGASLNETTTLNWSPALRPANTLIQLEIDADRIARNYPVEIPLVGDAQTILVELIYHLHRLIREGRQCRSARSVPTKSRIEYEAADLRQSDGRPLTPQRWRCDLEEVLPADAIVFSDVGGHMLFNLHYLRIRKGQRFVLNLGFGSMGHGTVAPIGAALAIPNAQVFAIIGDACFTMNGMDLLTAVEHDVRMIWIVEHNNMHGISWHTSRRLSGGRPLQSIRFKRHLEVASIARAMALAAYVVDGPGQIQEVVQRAMRAGGPTVIEVRVDPEIPPPMGARATSLAGYIDGKKGR